MWSKTNAVNIALLAWVLGSTILGRTFTAVTSAQYDAYIFAYFGEKWLEGYIPYLHLWDIKPPGIFFVNALTFSFAPKSFLALAIVEGVFILGCIYTVFAILRRLGAPRPAVILGTLTCAIYSNLSYLNQGGNLTEVYLLWPSALSVWMFIRASQEGRTRYLLFSGILAGIATSFKLVGLAPLLAQLAFLVLCSVLGRFALRRVLISASILLAGFVLAWVPWLIYFAWHGVVAELLKVSFLYPLFYGAESMSQAQSLPYLTAERYRPISGLLVFVGIGLVFLVPSMVRALRNAGPTMPNLSQEQWSGFGTALIALWFLADLAGAMGGGRLYPHYFLAGAGSLCVMAGLSFWHLTSLLHTPNWRVSTYVIGAMLSGVLLLHIQNIYNAIWAVSDPREPYPLITYLKQTKTEASTLFTWSFIPKLYFETGLSYPHKLTTALHLLDSEHMRRNFADDLMTTLEANSPTFIAERDRDYLQYQKNDESVELYERYQNLLKKKYDLVKTEKFLRLYKIRADRDPRGQ